MRGNTRVSRRASRLTIVVVVAAMLLAAAPVNAWAIFVPLDDLYGYVTDSETGAGLSGVNVELWKWEEYELDPDYFDGTTTGSTGRYAFNDLVSAKYDLMFQDPNGRYRFAMMYEWWWSGPRTRRDIQLVPNAERVAGQSRYSTAVAVARRGFDPGKNKSWPGVKYVVIASGEDRAAADPLAAAGLCWAYDAPLLLVSSTSVPSEVKTAVQEIVTANGPTKVLIVGGPVSVPDARFAELDAAVTGTLTKERLLTTGNRFDLAAAIARRVMLISDMDPAKDTPPAVLIANGADPTKFFDALALSPISAAKGCPILLVKATSVPAATSSAIKDLGFTRAIIGGGPNTVNYGVFGQIQGILDRVGGQTQRWYGQSRYTTAIVIAEKAVDQEHWLGYATIAVAAKLPDALAGGASVGHQGGVLVLTKGDSLTPETAAFLHRHRLSNWNACWVLGGKLSITDAVKSDMVDALAP
ncbi:MAG: cell wall-binding repeat-containing protein [Coriobacteriia bacterium]|nr:cell wall-binding repeat-containing protein [Coriobacteriia bacterium]